MFLLLSLYLVFVFLVIFILFYQATKQLYSAVKPWHSTEHYATRQVIWRELTRNFSVNDAHLPEGARRRIPQSAGLFEEALYRSADSLESYTNPDTLPERVNKIAQIPLHLLPTIGPQFFFGDNPTKVVICV